MPRILTRKSVLAALLIAASMIGLLATEINRRHGEALAGFQARHDDQAKALQHDVDGAFAIIKGLQAAAGSHLAQAEALNAAYLAALGPVADREGYGLVGLAPPQQASGRLNLTGLGSPDAPGLKPELNAALTLEPFFRWVKGVYPETPWVYYLSARRFMVVYPYVPFADFFMDDAFYSMALFQLGQPAVNRDQQPYITPVYEDEAGQGAMVTIGAPVHRDGDFLGIVGFDLTVNALSQALRQHHYAGDLHYLLSTDGAVVARVSDDDSADAVDGAAMNALARSPDRGRLSFHGDGRYRFATGVEGADWVVVSKLETWSVWREALAGSLPMFVFILVLAGGSWLYLRERRYQERAATESALVGERDKLQDMVAVRTRDLAQAKEAAEAGARAKAAFLANMSHEIRTPLNAVLGFAEIGQRESTQQASLVCFHRIINSGELLLRILDDVLDLSAIETGKLAVHAAPFAIAPMIEDAVDMVSREARSKSLMLTVDVDPDMPGWVMGDRVRLQQVLLNLLSNAIKFTDHGSIRVTAAWQQGQLRLGVADTGVGLSQAALARLFTPFEQADASMTRRHGGSGLGLSIANSLVRIMGGTIKASSQSGEGSEFDVVVPLPPANPPVPDTVQDEPGALCLQALRILVTDDDRINRNLLDYLLSREGAEVAFAENGLQAVDAVRSQAGPGFDLVLMDIQMPVMDGYEATRRIRTIAPDLPIVGLTAHVLADEAQQCRLAGMVEHLTKPCQAGTLIGVILQHVAADRRRPDTSTGVPD
jgi:signal transduction histidine kinase/CheY-like chemotaxis protein